MGPAVVGALLGVLLALGAAPLPAQAVGTGDPVILSPVAGQVVPQGWSGTLQVDFSNARPAGYLVQVECPPGEGDVDVDDYLFQDEFAYDGTQDDYQATIGPIHTPTLQRCQITVTDHFAGQGWALLDFRVAAGTLTLDDVSASPAVFYPLVRDFFRDSTVLHWSLGKPAGLRARIRNSAGRTVRYVNLGRRVGAGSWSWFGYRGDGARAAPGRFRVELVATDPERATVRRASRAVRIATAVRTHRTSRVRVGDSVTGSRVSGPCSVSRQPAQHGTRLACHGGGFAQAWFRFPVRASAFDAGGSSIGHAGCCTTGTVTRQLQRTSSRTYRVGMRVTGSRSFTITEVSITYSYRLRI